MREILSYFYSWSPNLVASQDGEVWRRHRRVLGPAFNNRLYDILSCCTFARLLLYRYQKVWVDTVNLYRQMEAAEGWSSKEMVDISSAEALSTKVRFLYL